MPKLIKILKENRANLYYSLLDKDFLDVIHRAQLEQIDKLDLPKLKVLSERQY